MGARGFEERGGEAGGVGLGAGGQYAVDVDHGLGGVGRAVGCCVLLLWVWGACATWLMVGRLEIRKGEEAALLIINGAGGGFPLSHQSPPPLFSSHLVDGFLLLPFQASAPWPPKSPGTSSTSPSSSPPPPAPKRNPSAKKWAPPTSSTTAKT